MHSCGGAALAHEAGHSTVKFWDLERFSLVSSTDIEASRVLCVAFCALRGGAMPA